MPPETVQKRRFPRYHTAVEVIVYQASDVLSGQITQISRGGCLIFPPLPPQPVPSVKISFRLNENMPFINCKGEIAYSVRDKGTGVAFTEISQYNQDLITEYFEKQLAAGKPAGA